MTIKPIFAWYDFWVGLFWDKSKKRLYFLPLPCVGVVLDFGTTDFYGTMHYRPEGTILPLCGTPTTGLRSEVTCKDCLGILDGTPAGIEQFRQ